MSKIADKNGLTNKYRSIDIGKRVVRRGRPRKHFSSSRRTKSSIDYSMTSSESKIAAIIIAVIAGIVLCCFLPIFIPIIVGALLMGVGDSLLKKIWQLPSGKWSAPASVGWMLLTGLGMIVTFILGLLILVGEMQFYAIIIAAVIYLILSALVLFRRYKKIQIKRQNGNEEI